MPASGSFYRFKTSPSGKKIRVTYSPNGRVLETKPVLSKANRTRTGKRLAARRRRINR